MNLNKTLLFGAIGFLFLTLLTPLIVSTATFFPYIVGKNILFRVCVEIAFGLWLLLAIRDPKFRPTWRSPILIAVAALTGIMLISDLHGVYPYKSIWSNFERMDGWVTLIHLAAFFVVVSCVLNSKKVWNWFLHGFLSISVVLGFIGLSQLAGGTERIDGSLGNSTYLGAFMLLSIFVCFYFLLKRVADKVAGLWSIVGYGVLAVFQTIILYYTGTRGSLLGLLGGIFLIAIILAFFEKENKILKRGGYALIALVVIFVLTGASIKNTNFAKTHPLVGRFSALASLDFKSIAENEGQTRFTLWHLAYEGYRERPMLGWGQENFNYVFNKYYDPTLYSQEQWFDRTHDIFFDWLVTGGTFGFLAYFSIFAATLYVVWKKRDNNFSLAERAVITGLLFGYIVHNIFVFDNITSYLLFFSIIGYVNFKNVPAEKVSDRQLSENAEILSTYLFAPVIVVLVFGLIYVVNVRVYEASTDLIQALSPQSSIGLNLDYFQKALAFNTVGGPETREQFLEISSQVAASSQVSYDDKVKFVQAASDAMQQQLKDTPMDSRYLLFYGNFLDNIGQYKPAIPFLEKARDYSPNKQTILFALGSGYLMNNQYDEAFSTFQKAYQLDTNFGQAKELYAASAVYSKKLDVVKELYGSATPIVDSIAKAYTNTGDYASALKIVRTEIVADPNNAATHLLIASIYVKEGDKVAAISELKKAETLDPKYASSADQLIKQLQTGK